MLFHERLKGLREDKDLTQQEVAEALHIERNTLSGYEIGYREPNLDMLVKIADYFDTTLDYLLCRTSLKVSFSKLYKKNKNE
ncbi:helix-turn-helix domain-containing protein [Clostridium magnum]|uniref:HTH-type transcriptional regulator ImmR n=1 Tax=Clostridium magnum DSM 2767 TaxID=1121326 RepID=A0A162U5Z0_9CLOT|nr:helix-turn-helix transcriptional regulator [Clostridium magnum]KZL93583.1 HTH-type transcriptional regulator ImmR [Clostridium magnum DSM 2767]SHI59282.1 DNA-binding transcriptional regulator, XRE-family HTH domain [Clostridium magnum DSM 2767]